MSDDEHKRRQWATTNAVGWVNQRQRGILTPTSSRNNGHLHLETHVLDAT
jgi:hypothetical protein